MATGTTITPGSNKPGPLLYKPAPKWQTLAAIGGAIAIHGLAAVIAGIHKEEPPADLSAIPEAVAEVTFEQAAPEPTPPPEEMDAAACWPGSRARRSSFRWVTLEGRQLATILVSAAAPLRRDKDERRTTAVLSPPISRPQHG